MKKVLILLAAPAILFFASCGGPSGDEEIIMPGMMKVEFPVAGNTLSMIIPDTTKGKLSIFESDWGATEIKVGDSFQVSVEQGDGDISLAKSDIDGNDVYNLQRYVIDEPNLIFWEAKIPIMPISNHHFYAIITSENTSYVINDIENGEAYDEASVQSMVDAAKTLRDLSPPSTEH